MIKKLKAKFYDLIKSLFSQALIESFRHNNKMGIGSLSQPSQIHLMQQYKNLYEMKANPPSMKDVGFRIHSQNEEDGILLFIFSLIGTTNKLSVEICCGNGIECNTANLIINHKWHGLMFDGREANIKKALKFYKCLPDTRVWPPVIQLEWITAENVDRLILDNGFSGDIDLLSIDVDGNDYWIWRAINMIKPRVVVIEFNHLFGPIKSVSIPYKPEFEADFTEYGSDYAGASLAAMIKLGKEKGYRLVATNAYATNAFFIRKDVNHPWLKEIDPTGCFYHPRAIFGMQKRYPKIKDKPWIEI